ncbi:hypothetical protein D3C72_2216940 [compost metagenome]
MEPLFESGGCQVGRGRIALLGQWPGPFDICSMAHRASLREEGLPIDILREGQRCLNQQRDA